MLLMNKINVLLFNFFKLLHSSALLVKICYVTMANATSDSDYSGSYSGSGEYYDDEDSGTHGLLLGNCLKPNKINKKHFVKLKLSKCEIQKG